MNTIVVSWIWIYFNLVVVAVNIDDSCHFRNLNFLSGVLLFLTTYVNIYLSNIYVIQVRLANENT